MTTPDLPWSNAPNRPIVLAFGGNALIPDPGEPRVGDGLQQRVQAFARALLLLLPDHSGMILVHGNGPQVGTLLLRVEATKDTIAPEPLDVLVAQTEGAIGYLLSRTLRNEINRRGRSVEISAVATQVLVAGDDPAFTSPTKPIGPFYPSEQATELSTDKGWDLVEVPGRGWRRVVASPRPIEAVEMHTIADAARHGHVVIAGGGGGIPVVRVPSGDLVGIEAVIDKDLTAAMLARSVRAAGFVILTTVDAVYRNFGTDGQSRIEEMSATEALVLLESGEFPPGSMGPKVEAAAAFASHSTRSGLITSVDALPDALVGRAGTWITPD